MRGLANAAVIYQCQSGAPLKNCLDTLPLGIYPSKPGEEMKKSDQLQGALEMVVLKTLQSGARHGFDIALHVQTVSEGLLRVEEGSLYPALHRMERQKLIEGEWRVTPNGRRARYYALTDEGSKRLAEAEASWNTVSQGIQRLLNFA
jgi:PadR family transcriptional regulator, regulatory protein PadR